MMAPAPYLYLFGQAEGIIASVNVIAPQFFDDTWNTRIEKTIANPYFLCPRSRQHLLFKNLLSIRMRVLPTDRIYSQNRHYKLRFNIR